MPLSSAEISNIIAAQITQMAGSLQYAQGVSGMAPHQAAGGSSPNHGQMAGLGGMAAGIPQAAMGAAGLAAEFGMAPRAFSPFSGTLHMASIGARGGGMAGAIGMGAMAAGAYAGAGAGLGWMTDQMMTGAQTRGALNQQVGGIFKGANSSQVGSVSNAIEGMSRQGVGTLNELTGLMQQGIGAGSLDSSSISNFQQSFGKLAANVRQVATILNSTLNEAHSAMESVKSMGIGSDQITSTIASMRGIGGGSGLSPGQMSAVAHSGAQFGTAAGIDPAQGARGAMVSAGMMNMAIKGGGFGNMNLGHQGRFTGAATRFLGSSHGRIALGAMMNETGGMDAGVAARMASGAMSGSEIRSAYRSNMGGGGRDMLGANQNELAASFISQHGAQAVSPLVGAMTEGSSRPKTLQKYLTGLTGTEMNMMSDLQAATPMLRQRLMTAAQEGFQKGTGQMTLTQALNSAFEKLSAPVKSEFEKLGASITQTITEQTEALTQQFVGGSQRATGGSAGVAAMGAMQATRNTTGIAAFRSLSGSLGQSFQTDHGQGPSGGVSSALPSILSLQRYGSGTDLSELPMGGAGSSEMSYAAMGAGAGAALGGSQAGSWLGSRMYGAGRSLMGFGSGAGWTGVGAARGTIAGAGLLGAGAGGALMGAARLAGAAALPVFAAGAIVNGIPELGRRAGLIGQTEGMILGEGADEISTLRGMGAISESNFGRYAYSEGADSGHTGYGKLRGGLHDSISKAGLDEKTAFMVEVEKAKASLGQISASKLETAKRQAKAGSPGSALSTFVKAAGIENRPLKEQQAIAAAAGAVGSFGSLRKKWSGKTAKALGSELEEGVVGYGKSFLANRGNYEKGLDGISGGDAGDVINILAADPMGAGGTRLSEVLRGNAMRGDNIQAGEQNTADLQNFFNDMGSAEKSGFSSDQFIGTLGASGMSGKLASLGHQRKYGGYRQLRDKHLATLSREMRTNVTGMTEAAGSVGISGDAMVSFARDVAKDPISAAEQLTHQIQEADLGTGEQIRLASNMPNTYAGNLFAATLSRHAHLQSVGESQGKRPERVLEAIGIHGSLSASAKKFLKSDSAILPANLYDHLTSGVRTMMTRSLGEDAATGTAVAANVNKIIDGLRDLSDGRADGNAKEMFSAISTMGHPGSPRSSSATAKDFANSLGVATEGIKNGIIQLKKAGLI